MTDTLSAIGNFFAVLMAFFNPPADPALYGYIEADLVYIAPTVTQRLTSVSVEEGDDVAVGDLLFDLDQADPVAALAAMQAEERAAAAKLDNLLTGSRPEELRVIEASLAEARIVRDKAKQDFERTARLTATGVASETALRNDRATYDTAKTRVSQLAAELEVARLPARSPEIDAADAQHAASEAAVERAFVTLDKYSIHAPVAGRVERVYLAAGEVAGPTNPVLSILPPAALEVHFFVPEARRMEFNVGRTVVVDCDGCGSPFKARIVQVASEPEFTPPIIYSREERHRLIFLTKAVPVDRDLKRLLPGQPVTVKPDNGA